MLLVEGLLRGSSFLYHLSSHSLIGCAIYSIKAMVIVEEQCALSIFDKLAHTDTPRVTNEIRDAIPLILYAFLLIL